MLPRGLRRNALAGVAARLARKPDAAPPANSNGVAVAGDIAGSNGLAASARILHEVIAAHGLARGLVPMGLPGVVPAYKGRLPEESALLAVVNAPFLPAALLRMRRNILQRRRVIGMWAWELPAVPRPWRCGAAFVHEVWAPSPFTAAALEAIAPGRVRVVPYPLAGTSLPVEGDRGEFGLPANVLLVLTVVNLSSGAVRKNPLGAIAAFKAAFAARMDCILVLKVSGFEAYPYDLHMIREAAGSAPNIRLITDTMPEAALRGLIAASDIVLSLHRAEGFGLIPANAMLLGKPVVATGWSGNLAYMTAQTASLVSYRLLPPSDDRGVYDVPGAVWAAPEIEDAAARLAALAADSAARSALGKAGQAHAHQMLGPAPLLAALAANGIGGAREALRNQLNEAALEPTVTSITVR
jgi:glycosyltransferase involved in cell wall biosynthesis